MQKASQAGQKIYQINLANMNQVLPQLNHDPATMDEIRRALQSGKEVTTHTDAVSIPGGWSGFGYIIIDADTGDGAYKISGGSNGAHLIITGAVLLSFSALFLALAVTAGPVGLLVATTGPVGGVLAAPIVVSIAAHLGAIELWARLHTDSLDVPCFMSGIVTTVSVALLASGPILGAAAIAVTQALPGLPTLSECL